MSNPDLTEQELQAQITEAYFCRLDYREFGLNAVALNDQLEALHGLASDIVDGTMIIGTQKHLGKVKLGRYEEHMEHATYHLLACESPDNIDDLKKDLRHAITRLVMAYNELECGHNPFAKPEEDEQP
jgi:hypothetical protein